MRRLFVAASLTILVAAMCVGAGFVQPPQAHACTCTTSKTTGSGNYYTAKPSGNDVGSTDGSGGSDTSNSDISSGIDTGTTGTGTTGTGSISGPDTTGSTGGPDDTVDYGGFAGYGGGGGGTPLHVTSAPRLPASAGVWSSGGWALGGMLHGGESQWPASGPWAEDPLCLTAQCSTMTVDVQTNKGTLCSVPGGCEKPTEPVCSVDCGSTTEQVCSVGCDPPPPPVCTVGCDFQSDPAPAVAVSSPVPVPAEVPVELPQVVPERPVVDFAPPTRDFAVVLMSSVGSGFSAVIIILILLTIGVWYFGHRVAVQLTTVEGRNA